jgi:ABC-type lipoprotein export system ATPase subunit
MILKLINIHKHYKIGEQHIHALKGINLEIEEGEFLAIQGPSGAGKSTLLHIIGGLGKPDEGKVLFRKEDVYSWNDIKLSQFRNKKIGFVFQFYHLLPEFTLLENIMLPALISGINFTQAKNFAYKLLDYFLLQKRKDSFPNQLSGGEQQRGAIARALINNPQILLCDEPTGNLDSKLGEEVLKFISKINKEQKKTVIVVTHDDNVAKWAGWIVYIKDGILIHSVK